MASNLNSDGPAQRHAAVTTSDTVDLPEVARALYVGTGGDIVVVTRDGVAVTYKNFPSGGYLSTNVRRVNATTTTATDIVALY